MSGDRIASIDRKTRETDIRLTLNLDGGGESRVQTGIGFFDHMLFAFARHGFFDLDLKAQGDLEVDCHHTAEDVGIVLGTAIREAVGDKQGIRRFGSMILPMDEALALCAIDLSGRPAFSMDAEFSSPKAGEMETETVREFFSAVSCAAGMNLHMKILSGRNDHHKIEALFKAFAKALDEAVSRDARVRGVLSTKGSL